MTRNRVLLPILLVAVLAIAAVITATSGGSKAAASRTPAGGAISVAKKPVGNALVDANGRTLYLFAGDTPNVSRLSAAGQAVWPPFTSSGMPEAGGGTSAAQVGTVAGTRQITYNGHPLYYYVGDHHPGQIAGQNLNEFGARWYVLSASGAAITSASTTGSTSQSGSGASTGAGAGYGY